MLQNIQSLYFAQVHEIFSTYIFVRIDDVNGGKNWGSIERKTPLARRRCATEN